MSELKPEYLKQIYRRKLPELTAEQVADHHKRRDYDRLFCEYAHIVPYIVQRYIGDHAALDTDELMQQGNIAALKSIKSWRPAKGSAMLSWIYLHVRFEVIKEAERQRARKKDGELATDTAILEDTQEDNPQNISLESDISHDLAQDMVQDTVEAIEQQQAIQAAIDSLPEQRDREIMVMHLAGMTQAEISRGLDYLGHEPIGQPQISRIVRKGLESIRHKLQDYSE